MQAKAAQELGSGQGHRLLLAVFTVIFIAESDFPVVEIEEAMVGNGRFVGVAAEVLDDAFRPGKRGFGVDDPGFLVQFIAPGGDGLLFGRGRGRQVECSVRPSGHELAQVDATEDLGDGLDGEQKSTCSPPTRLDPAALLVQPTGGYDAVDVGM